ncbi:MAG: hypothetical protein ABI321_12575 [Polyangia bacterium]
MLCRNVNAELVAAKVAGVALADDAGKHREPTGERYLLVDGIFATVKEK